MNRAFIIQGIILMGSYYVYKRTLNILDRYSNKYLSNLQDEEILNFEKQDPKAINLMGNNGGMI